MTEKQRSSTRRRVLTVAGSTTLLGLAGCLGTGSGGGAQSTQTGEGEMTDGETTEGSTESGMEPTDPDIAPRATIDRFSDAAGTLHVRSANGDLPGTGEPIDFDERFLVTGYGPDGDVVQYYDFDVMPTGPAPIYAFFRENGNPVEDQRNVVGVVPSDDGYSDFWRVNKVTVPDDYQANAITSVAALQGTDYDIEVTDTIKNCPIVPDESTASERHDTDESGTGLVEGWYDGKIVYYFLFGESSLEVANGSVPRSPIYVSFNTNSGQDGGGPPSGFMTEDGNQQTHNVTATVPGDAAYSPLWTVNVYDNADFGSVSDLDSATDAELLAAGAARVNCPVVSEN